MVGAAPGTGQLVVDVHDAEREMRPAALADALLLAVEAVPVGPVVRKVPQVRANWRRGQRGDTAQRPRSSPMRSLTNLTASGDRSMPAHSRCSRSAATSAVAQPQNGSSTMSPGSLDALRIRSSSASGFWVGISGAFPCLGVHGRNVRPDVRRTWPGLAWGSASGAACRRE